MKFWFSMKTPASTDEERILMMRDFFQDNFIYILYGLILAAAMVGGWQWWLWDKRQDNHDAATAYIEHLILKQELEQGLDDGLSYDELDADKVRQAQELIDRFQWEYKDTAYSALTHLNQASWLTKAQRLYEAAETLEWAVNNAIQPVIKSLSTTRLARLLIEMEQPEQAVRLLDSFIPSKPMNVLFEEVRGDAYYVLKRYPQAAMAYNQAYTESVSKPLFLRMKMIESAQYLPVIDQP